MTEEQRRFKIKKIEEINKIIDGAKIRAGFAGGVIAINAIAMTWCSINFSNNGSYCDLVFAALNALAIPLVSYRGIIENICQITHYKEEKIIEEMSLIYDHEQNKTRGGR